MTVINCKKSVLRPPSSFLVPLPNAARLNAHTRWLFLNIHCAHFDQKKNCRVRSGQVRSPEAVSSPHLRKACNRARARVFDWSISSLQVLVRVPVCAMCISQNCYIYDLRSGQLVTFILQAYGKILKCLLFCVNESKPPNSFSTKEDYLIGNDPGAAYWVGHREKSFEVMWRHKSFFVNKSRHDGAKDL